MSENERIRLLGSHGSRQSTNINKSREATNSSHGSRSNSRPGSQEQSRYSSIKAIIPVQKNEKEMHPALMSHANTKPDRCKKYRLWIIIFIVCALALIIGLSVGLTSRNEKPVPPTPTPPTPVPPTPPVPPPLPDEFNPYHIVNSSLQLNVDTVSGHVKANLTKLNQLMSVNGTFNGMGIKATPRKIPVGLNNEMFSDVYFEFGQVDFRMVKALFKTSSEKRFSIPEDLVPKPESSRKMRLEYTGFELIKDPFGFKFVDPLDINNTLITTLNQTFIVQDKYLQLDLILPSRRIFGLGERTSDFMLTEGTWTMWANGEEKTEKDNGSGGKQSHGVHPFVLVQTAKAGEFMGIFFRNSNLQSPVIRYLEDPNPNVTSTKTLFSYITTGGQMEVYFMFKGSASQIIGQYQNLVGKPNFPPFWSFGWNSAGKSYVNQTLLEANLKGYFDNDFPLEGVWLDASYMKDFTDFTVDTNAFPAIGEMTRTLQHEGKRMVLTVGPGLPANDPKNIYFGQAMQQNVLLKSNINKDTNQGALTQKGWSNQTETVFLDFMASEAKPIWAQALNDLWNQIPFDGLRLDMNEATAFCDGECPDQEAMDLSVDSSKTIKDKMVNLLEGQEITNHTWWFSYLDQNQSVSTYFLPFIPGTWNLDHMALSLNASHPSNNETEYNLHSLFGLTQGKVTYESLTNQSVTPLADKRVLIQSRSTFSGSGKYVQHWQSNNGINMRSAIAGIMNFNMFGIPHVGSDVVCGDIQLQGVAELCVRWVQLSTFFPFARQQELENNEIWRLPEPYLTTARNALFDRLQYIRHFYTCFYEASIEGGTCFDPLFFSYPNLNQTFENITDTFIVAGTFKVSPVLEQNVTTYHSFFPNGNWVSMKNFGDVLRVNNVTGGEMVEMANPTDTVNVHLKPGKIATFQDNRNQTKKLTRDMMKEKGIQYIVNRNEQNHANIASFFDDGESLSQLETKQFEYYKFLHNDKSFIKQALNDQVNSSTGFYLEKLVITNAADLKSIDTACFIATNGSVHPLSVTHDNDMNLLNISAPQDQNAADFTFFEMRSIQYLEKGKDINYCNLTTDFYKTSETPDLTGNYAEVVFTSQTMAARDILMTFRVLGSGVLSIKWTYNDIQAAPKVPFQVPNEIIDVDLTPKEGAILSDFVSITDVDGNSMISIMRDGEKQYEIRGFMLDEFLNYIDTMAYTAAAPMSGLLGALDQEDSTLFLQDGFYSFWTYGAANPPSNKKLPNSNHYIANPFFMAKSTNGWFGVLNNNAAAQDWKVTNNETSVKLTTTATGGMGDLYIMLGQTANEVVQMYHQGVVGTPVQVPQWSLGWGQCRYGYFNLTKMEEVVGNYSSFDLPLDNFLSDISYMDRYRDFTYDDVNFKGLPDFVSNLTTKNMQWLPILDAGIAKRPLDLNYSAYQQLSHQEAFIKYGNNTEFFTGSVWPGDTVYVDWFYPAIDLVWKELLKELFEKVAFSGFWLDMNEATNHCSGACYDKEISATPVKERLPYVPTGRDLEAGSITLDAYNYDGSIQLDTHSLYATMMSKSTYEYFQGEKKRSVLLSRSMFAGHGKYASRWMGDNYSTQQSMGFSVNGIMQHNIMGVPLVGADVCGFNLDTTPELCARWYGLASFYTWSRNHDEIHSISQEPYLFATDIYEGSITILDIIRKAMWTKFIFVKYMYSSLLDLSMNGGTLHRPLFFEFDHDEDSYRASSELNFMLGDRIKISVNSNMLDRNQTEFYFPEGNWCNLLIANGTNTCMRSLVGGHNITLRTKAYDVYAHLREASIVVLQDGKSLVMENGVRTTEDLNSHPVEMHINPNCFGPFCRASGTWNNDDGRVFDNTDKMNSYNFTMDSLDRTGFVLFFEHLAQATYYDNNVINNNDLLKFIRIHNAAAYIFDTNFTVVVTLLNDSVVNYHDATYNSEWDTLEFENTEVKDPIWMPNVKSIKFTRK